MNSYVDTDRHYHDCDAIPLESPLDSEGSFVVECLLKGVIMTKDQLPREDCRSRELFHKGLA